MQNRSQLSDAGAAVAPPPPQSTFPRVTVPPPPRPGGGWAGRSLLVPLVALAAAAGLLLGGRAAAEDGRTAAAAALAAGDPAQAVALDEAVAARSGFLMILDPGARAAATHDAQVARIAWATQLARSGRVDAAVAVLALVGEPSLLGAERSTRAQVLLDAAAAAIRSGDAALALLRLDEASRGNPPAALATAIATMRASDEVTAAAELVAAHRAPDAVPLLDDAAANGAAAPAASAYPATLLAAGRSEIAGLDFVEATAMLQRLVTGYPATAQARTARQLLRAPQAVTGTLVDAAGHGAQGRVRLSTHFTQLPGGYLTSGPFYYGTSDAAGDFSVPSVPVGGPYVLEYYRSGGWMTLVDPRTDQPANPVTVTPLAAQDLTFIVLPA